MKENFDAAEVIEITLESEIETSLVKHNVTDAVIAELKNKYGNLKLRNLEDKEMYLEIKAAAKDCSKLRNLATKICKEGREDAVKIQKLWVAKEKEVIGKISEVESPLDAEIEAFDNEVDRKKNEEKQRQEELYMQRTQALTKMGALYANNSFILGEFSLEANLIKESNDETWVEQILPEFIKEFEKIEFERLEKERIANEKREEERKQRAEFEKQQDEFRKQQQEFENQRREQERIDHERRMAEEKKNMELNSKRLHLLNPYNPYSRGIDIQNLYTISENDFILLVDNVKNDYANEQEALKLKMQEEIARKEREMIADEQRQIEIKRQQEEARKAEELAKAGDKEQWLHFIAELSKIVVPTGKSGQYRKITGIAKEKIEEILTLKP